MAKQTNSTVVPFLFEGDGLVRVVKRDGEPWFVASDVARVLGYRDAPNAVRRLQNDEIAYSGMSSEEGDQSRLVVSESGLYALIFCSRKPKAIKFRRWVTAEVLPSIRKTGGYQTWQDGRSRAGRAEDRLFLDKMKGAAQLIDSIRRASGNRPAAHAAPQICAALGIVVDLAGSDTLAQGELPLAETAETVH